MLRAVNDLKSEVGGIRRLLAEHGITHEDPPRKSNQQGAAGKENVRDPTRSLVGSQAQQQQLRARARTAGPDLRPHICLYAKN